MDKKDSFKTKSKKTVQGEKVDHYSFADGSDVKDEVSIKTLMDDDADTSIFNTQELEVIRDNIEDEKEERRQLFRFHFNYQLRVTLLVVGIILLFGFACFLVISTLNDNVSRVVNYKESTAISYKACTDVENEDSCVGEGSTYSSSTIQTIPIKFHYQAVFDEVAHFEKTYYVAATTRIYDRFDLAKTTYEDEDLIFKRKSISTDSDIIDFDVTVNVDFYKYNAFVVDYLERFAMGSSSTLDVVLYVDDGDSYKAVAKAIIPLGKSSFDVLKEGVGRQDASTEVLVHEWSNRSTLCVLVGSVLVVLSLVLLSQLTKLVLASTTKKSKYEQILNSILNEYDKYIVIARDGFETDVAKRVVKVDSFKELMDARDILNKPIIYSKVNNVKSEFIVEDVELIYKFVLKEADLDV